MPVREKLVAGECYHVFNKSIGGFQIFRYQEEFERLRLLFRYYQYFEMPSFSNFMKGKGDSGKILGQEFQHLISGKNKYVNIIAYCIMPTHFHMALRPLQEGAVPTFIGNILNGYTRYFNSKIKRKGPLWQNRYKSIIVSSNEQLLHLTRYLHLNPVSGGIIDFPEDWRYSSYREYVDMIEPSERMCEYQDLFSITPERYRQFVIDRSADQRELEKIKANVRRME